MQFDSNREFALKLDNEDSLKNYRNEFFIPQVNGRDSIYLCGNSLGLQPKNARAALEQEMKDWEDLGVEGHFHGKNPWFHYHKFLTEKTARLVGANPKEVVVMNNLTVNLHLLMVSFYRPTEKRFKIIMEGGAFPSDMYAMESQVKSHGFAYEDAVIEVFPREGETGIRTEDIVNTIKEHGEEVALVMFSGVQYYTGQYFDIETITRTAHEVGANAGWDLAHAAGNVELKLHDWGVDFAVWCSYKYLNSGPGSVSGCFVHDKYANAPELTRFAGWWGHKEDVRFQMDKGYIPEEGAAGWQLSNAPVFTMAVHNASLEMFDKVGMKALAEKGFQLNAYLENIVKYAEEKNPKLSFEIITPPAPARGCQLSLLTGDNGKDLFDYLTENGVIADWRNPNVIRMAPVPMYNSFEDLWKLGDLMANY
jgi:kynureninase